ncbi:VWA domain-containing protein [Rhizobium sp. XQZ8]|uniref:TadE/TadG family type IV pilus assembly protein n=1 Tax=Rhizobium populisoli TaxID=2859785 RepID=UPI001C935474|nr:TadE/TadG family type IV pilus assembly protein [Rhizobium populisoli]MBW6421716.1 VWA domain-containing protein [Rhizobium populisoli]
MAHSLFPQLMKDRSGNFGIMTAIMLPVLLAVAGVAIDVTSAVEQKSRLQGLTDSAALAAASSMAAKGTNEADSKELAKDFLASQLIDYVKTGKETPAELAALDKAIRDASTVDVKQTTDTAGKIFDVSMTSSYDMPLNAMTSMFAGKTMKVQVASSARSTSVSETAISMYLALDRSGSMSFVTDEKNPLLSLCINYTETNWAYQAYLQPSNPCYIRKIQALQTAASGLFKSLNTSDPKNNLVRVGAVSYTDSTQAATGMHWGTTFASTYVSALPSVPTGGTDASGAMQIAYDALKKTNTTEATAHQSKSHSNFQRYILLMTDGEMTGGSSSWNSALDKKVRDLCDKAKLDGDTNGNGKIDGSEQGIIIFTVAFMAPSKGKELLSYCASGTENYYQPTNMQQLITDFGEIAEKAAKTTTRLTN